MALVRISCLAHETSEVSDVRTTPRHAIRVGWGWLVQLQLDRDLRREWSGAQLLELLQRQPCACARGPRATHALSPASSRWSSASKDEPFVILPYPSGGQRSTVLHSSEVNARVFVLCDSECWSGSCHYTLPPLLQCPSSFIYLHKPSLDCGLQLTTAHGRSTAFGVIILFFFAMKL